MWLVLTTLAAAGTTEVARRRRESRTPLRLIERCDSLARELDLRVASRRAA